MNSRIYALALSLLALSPMAVAPSEERPNRKDIVNELFMPELFGATLKWFGVVGATVFFDSTCVFPPGEEIGPDQRCIILNPAPAVTAWDEREIAKITFPGNTFKHVICPVFLHNLNYQLRNTTGASHDARMDHRTYITIESEALNDPSAVDPETGLPYGGKLDIPWGARIIANTLDDGARLREVLQFTRACNAGMNRPNFEGMGLPPAVVTNLFKNPITIHLGLRGSAQLLEFGLMNFSMRVTGH